MGPQWFKSSYSNSTANCVEVALQSPAVGVRDSKDPALAALAFPSSAWAAFLREVR